MKRNTSFWQIFTFLVFLAHGSLMVQGQDLDLTQLDWKVWMDEEALWEKDRLFLPGEFCLGDLPVNAPTVGWDEVYSSGQTSTLPVVVEELFSGGDATWTYHGVSWFTAEFDVPADWKDRVIRLYVGKKNRRLEVFVNEELSGYDLISSAPYTCDISEKLKPGEKNRLAFRITNPGGGRGWGDFPVVKWGDFNLPPGRDFGGIGGEVILRVSDPVYLEEVFVQNLLPAGDNQIAVELILQNTAALFTDASLDLKILDGDHILYSGEQTIGQLPMGDSLIKYYIKVPEAKQWDIAAPHLYTCSVSLRAGEYYHEFSRKFGFRVFEVKENEQGQQNFYLNGKRFRHRSAIDWSFYAHHGFYPSEGMAEKSVANVLAIGHNGINCHRHMADELLLKMADELGILILEEPGGFDAKIRTYGEGYPKPWSFDGQLMRERCLRMAKRDRHHPSVAGYILANEREDFDLLRKNVMIEMHTLDPSKLVVNQSGGHPGGPAGQIPHIRPYDNKFRVDYFDDHTVSSEEAFKEYEFFGHQGAEDRYSPGVYGLMDPMAHDNIVYWGEVRCYTGPDNWVVLDQQSEWLPGGRTGYNFKNSEILAGKTMDYFTRNRLGEQEGSSIKKPEDLSVQAGRGLMYSNGRLGQIIMSNNSEDGYAINGWSGGSSVLPPGYPSSLEWYSAMVDEGRNLKGPASDLAYWIRPLQLAIFRNNGKYFEPGDTIRLKVDLITEGILEAGTYAYQIRLRDGAGKLTEYLSEGQLEVKGGDCYAQSIKKELQILIPGLWHGGYLTIEGSLLQGDRILAEGAEQVLLKNPSSFGGDLADYDIEVHGWPAAEQILDESGYSGSGPGGESGRQKVLLAGEPLSESMLKSLLKEVKKGAHMIIRLDSLWAEQLYDMDVLSAKVNTWGGRQIPHWKGNGWGFISVLPGSMSMPGKGTIGTNAWEVSGDPVGFAPFESKHPQTSYGAWFARPDKLLTLFGEISYGKGRILLAPSYPVDGGNAFSDLLFFNMIIN